MLLKSEMSYNCELREASCPETEVCRFRILRDYGDHTSRNDGKFCWKREVPANKLAGVSTG
jgi:hypothetical protein